MATNKKKQVPGKGESLSNKIRRFNEAIDENVPYELSSFQRFKLFMDFQKEYRKNGVLLLDYIQYNFYDKQKEDRRNYVVHGRLLEIMRTCNNPEHRYIFDEKPEFDKAFSKYLHRDYLYLKDASWEDFEKFLEGKDCFFAKDPKGMFGLGVQKYTLSEVEDLKALFDELKSHEILCEESLTQCEEMAEFNDTSINTLRVVSMVPANGEPEIVGGLLRLGRKGRIADNFHHHGICAYIDPKYGIVTTEGVDKDNVRHVVHPDSGKQIVGFKVPYWDDVVRTIKEAALVVPDMRYIGWDVAITKDHKIALVEGNPGADPDAEQITTKQGRWPLYEAYLKEIRAL